MPILLLLKGDHYEKDCFYYKRRYSMDSLYLFSVTDFSYFRISIINLSNKYAGYKYVFIFADRKPCVVFD